MTSPARVVEPRDVEISTGTSQEQSKNDVLVVATPAQCLPSLESEVIVFEEITIDKNIASAASSSPVKSVGPKLVPFFKSVAVYLVLVPEGPSLWAAGVKCAPVLSLMFFVLLHGVGQNDEYAFSRRILVGLGFSCIGDALLVWPHHFLTGMAAFGVAQCAYTSAFKFTPLRPKLGAAIYAITLFVVWLLLPGAPGVLKVGVPVYSLLLATMAWRATARLQLFSRWTWTELCSCGGGIFFVISDGLIGFNGFYAPIHNAQVLIMSTYYLAQLGIALSVVDSISEYHLSQEKKILQCQREASESTDKCSSPGLTEELRSTGSTEKVVRRKSKLNTA